jgi:hypothetical protein
MMLARTFKTAAELGLLDHEYEALHEVLRRLEDGRIPLRDVNMFMFHCGTTHCLAGWANVIDANAFPETRGRSITQKLADRLPDALSCVFTAVLASGARARYLLRHYLQTGEYDWIGGAGNVGQCIQDGGGARHH